jgi:Putative adhesin
MRAVFAAGLLWSSAARASGGVDGGSAFVSDRREIVVPAVSVEMLRIDNPLGRVEIRGTGRPGEIHVLAEKRAASAEALARLRVHYTAFQNGEVQVDTRVELGGRERSLPLSGSGVDLVVEVPSDVAVEAKTFGGDVSATGLRAGARLETTGGRIGVSDVRGGVVTRQLRGGQSVKAVDGDVDLDGVEGDMDVRGVGGGRIDARLVDGSIRAEDVRSSWVRLTTTTGEIVLLGVIRPAAHYDLRSYAGDVRVLPAGELASFELRARSGTPVSSALPLRGMRRQGEWLRAEYVAAGPRPVAPAGAREALLEMSSVLGRVIIQPHDQKWVP